MDQCDLEREEDPHNAGAPVKIHEGNYHRGDIFDAAASSAPCSMPSGSLLYPVGAARARPTDGFTTDGFTTG